MPSNYKTNLISVIACRYAVFICGKKAIQEALITKSVDFADRPEFYTTSLTNPDFKGCDVSCYHCLQCISVAFVCLEF